MSNTNAPPSLQFSTAGAMIPFANGTTPRVPPRVPPRSIHSQQNQQQQQHQQQLHQNRISNMNNNNNTNNNMNINNTSTSNSLSRYPILVFNNCINTMDLTASSTTTVTTISSINSSKGYHIDQINSNNNNDSTNNGLNTSFTSRTFNTSHRNVLRRLHDLHLSPDEDIDDFEDDIEEEDEEEDLEDEGDDEDDDDDDDRLHRNRFVHHNSVGGGSTHYTNSIFSQSHPHPASLLRRHQSSSVPPLRTSHFGVVSSVITLTDKHVNQLQTFMRIRGFASVQSMMQVSKNCIPFNVLRFDFCLSYCVPIIFLFLLHVQ